MPKQPYSLIYAPAIKEQLLQIDKEHHSLIRDAIAEQLTFESEVESRNPETAQASCCPGIGMGNTVRISESVSGVLQSPQESKDG